MIARTQNDKPCVIHYSSVYLPFTCNWLYHQLIYQERVKPVFLSRKVRHREKFPGITVHSLDQYSLLRQAAEVAHFKIKGYFRFMDRLSRDYGARVLHVHFGYHGVKMAGLAARLGVRSLCSFYGDDAYNFPLRRGLNVYQRLFRVYNRILVLGPAMKAQLVQLGCPPEKIIIHHLGTPVKEVPFRKRQAEPGEKLRFMLACNLVKKKGVDVALHAFARLAESYSFSVDILGEGPLEDELKRLTQQLGLTERVTFQKFKTHEKLIAHMHSAHVFVQASRTTEDSRKEGTPVVLMDAMASGMPVVSTRHSDIPELVHDGINGFLAEENDVDSLTQALRNILDNREQLMSLGYAGRQHVEREFDALTQARRLEDIYFNLLAEKATG